MDLDSSVAIPDTPAARPTTRTRSRRVRIERHSSDDEEFSPASIAPSTTHHTVISRSQRASKTAALSKMSAFTASAKRKNPEIEDLEEEDEDSDVTSEDCDESDEES